MGVCGDANRKFILYEKQKEIEMGKTSLARITYIELMGNKESVMYDKK